MDAAFALPATYDIKELIRIISMCEIQSTVDIAKRPFISTKIAELIIRWLIDSGASLTCLSEQLFDLIPTEQTQRLPLPPELSIQTASGHLFEITGLFVLPINIGKSSYRHPVVIIRNLAANAILGTDFLNRTGANIDFANKKVTFGNAPTGEKSVTATNFLDAQEVVTAEVTTVMPHSVKWISCKTTAKGLGFVESEFLAVSAALLKADGKNFKIQLHNATDTPLQFKRNMHVGVFSAAAEEDLIPIDKLKKKAREVKKMSAEKKAKGHQRLRAVCEGG